VPLRSAAAVFISFFSRPPFLLSACPLGAFGACGFPHHEASSLSYRCWQAMFNIIGLLSRTTMTSLTAQLYPPTAVVAPPAAAAAAAAAAARV